MSRYGWRTSTACTASTTGLCSCCSPERIGACAIGLLTRPGPRAPRKRAGVSAETTPVLFDAVPATVQTGFLGSHVVGAFAGCAAARCTLRRVEAALGRGPVMALVF